MVASGEVAGVSVVVLVVVVEEVASPLIRDRTASKYFKEERGEMCG